MHVTDLVNAGAVVAQLAILVLTALYLRGKLDGDAAARGAAREAELETLREEMRDVAGSAIRTEEGLRAHLDECGRHYEAMTRALERLERRLEILADAATERGKAKLNSR